MNVYFSRIIFVHFNIIFLTHCIFYCKMDDILKDILGDKELKDWYGLALVL